MFQGGVQDQFHQFLVAEASPPPQIRPSSTSLPFSLFHGSLSSNPNPNFPIFEPYNPNSPHHLQPPIHSHHHIMQNPPLELQYQVASQIKSVGSCVKVEEGENINPWSHDEVLALFRVRSAMENWFPEFTWEHVSRKLEEIGFRRSPQKCKEKFEEESRSYLQTTTTNTTSTIHIDEVSCPNKNYRLFSELEELYHHGCEDRNQNDVVLDKQTPQEEMQEQEDDDNDDDQGQERLLDENNGSEAIEHHQQVDMVVEVEKDTNMEKRNGKKKFEIFKSFCEDIVNKMMTHQEELHNKILEDLIKRDDEKIAREEAWKKQEMERLKKEMEDRAKEQAMAGDRQVKIIEFLKKLTSNSSSSTNIFINKNDEFNALINQNPSSSATHSTSQKCHIPTSSNDESLSQTSNSLTTHIDPIAPTSNSAQDKNKIQEKKPRTGKKCYNNNSDKYDDIGKRWPREEVIALINIRCNLDATNNTGPDMDRNESNKNPPLWERISKSMMELGYKRSAKRCKEKWENINKYFRKTKDSKKKRSVDSRTCPYFHQLSHMYNNGQLSGTSHGGPGGSSGNAAVGGDGATLNVSDQGEANAVFM